MFQTIHETYTKNYLSEIQIELGVVFIWPNYDKGSAERDTQLKLQVSNWLPGHEAPICTLLILQRL